MKAKSNSRIILEERDAHGCGSSRRKGAKAAEQQLPGSLAKQI